MPKRVLVKLKKCIQNSEEAGSDDRQTISRVFYGIVVNGNKQGAFHSDIKQVVGSDYSTEDIEVTAPEGYTGPTNPERFARGIRNYYERLLGDAGVSPCHSSSRRYEACCDFPGPYVDAQSSMKNQGAE